MRTNIIITIDYETWQPSAECNMNIPYKIDWEKDLIVHTELILEMAERIGAKITLMAEMGEYFWLKKNIPSMAEKVASQLRDTVRRGHDVQLHLHPHWMPELNAGCDERGMWTGEIRYALADNYPYDLQDLITRCVCELENIIRPVKDDYQVVAFRAGGYRIQPFNRLYEALANNQIICDTSIYRGGFSREYGYDFRNVKHPHQPYYMDKDKPAEEDKQSSMFELPIYTPKYGKRWVYDFSAGENLAFSFLDDSKFDAYNENFLVMVGHSKEEHDFTRLSGQLEILSRFQSIKWCNLSEAANIIRVNHAQFSRDVLTEQDFVSEITEYLRRLKTADYKLLTGNQLKCECIILAKYMLKLGADARLILLHGQYDDSDKYYLIKATIGQESYLIDLNSDNVFLGDINKNILEKRLHYLLEKAERYAILRFGLEVDLASGGFKDKLINSVRARVSRAEEFFMIRSIIKKE